MQKAAKQNESIKKDYMETSSRLTCRVCRCDVLWFHHITSLCAQLVTCCSFVVIVSITCVPFSCLLFCWSRAVVFVSELSPKLFFLLCLWWWLSLFFPQSRRYVLPGSRTVPMRYVVGTLRIFSAFLYPCVDCPTYCVSKSAHVISYTLETFCLDVLNMLNFH